LTVINLDAKLKKNLWEAQGTSVNGKLYVFGGFVNGYRTMGKATWQYSPNSDSWNQRTDMPATFDGVSHMANAADGSNRNIYLLGGIANVDGGNFPKEAVAIADVLAYNTDTDKWSTLPSLPEARGGGAAVVLKNKLHFFNGAKFDGTNGGFQEDMTDHWVLDLMKKGGGWKSLKSNSLGRNHVGGVVFDGLIYAIGGQFFEEEGCSNQKIAEVYNPATNKWRRIADLPIGTGHISPSTVATKHGIVVVGGVTDKNRGCKPPGYKRSQLLFYNPKTDTWADIQSPVAGASMVAGVINGDIYAQHGSGVQKIQLKWSSARKGRAVTDDAATTNNQVLIGSVPVVLIVAGVAGCAMTLLLAVGIILAVNRRQHTTAVPAVHEACSISLV
jgi:N-acetylneuraminic acid mutarotase